MADDHESRERATARGEHIRAVLLAKLIEDGPATAEELFEYMPREISLSEVVFQLERLAEEGGAAGSQGGEYSAL